MRSPTNPRGLTLIEVLMATAILAMLAAATAPLIARAIALLEQDARPRAGNVQSADLAAAVELVMHEPDRFGLKAEALHELEYAEIAWPSNGEGAEATAHPSIVIRALRSSDEEADHCWLAFECEGLTVTRWLPLPESQAKELPP